MTASRRNRFQSRTKSGVGVLLSGNIRRRLRCQTPARTVAKREATPDKIQNASTGDNKTDHKELSAERAPVAEDGKGHNGGESKRRCTHVSQSQPTRGHAETAVSTWAAKAQNQQGEEVKRQAPRIEHALDDGK